MWYGNVVWECITSMWFSDFVGYETLSSMIVCGKM